MEFIDLSDEIIADDWLVRSEDISDRRLIKQTPRHNIYKADWFGEVLIYEPVQAKREQQRQITSRRHLSLETRAHDCANQFGHLSLSLSGRSSSLTESRSSLNSDCESLADSAYSSVSSTPQYHTKSLENGFEFPNCKSDSSSPFAKSITATQTDTCWSDETFTSSPKIVLASSINKQANHAISSRSPVKLNEDSYKFNHDFSWTQGGSQELEDESSMGATRSHWFELNELRLVAHESFMLFMGASMSPLESSSGSHSTSLVMQMNHPKSVTLYNLLHTSKFAATPPPMDRFFNFKQAAGQQLDAAAKLNICQQVTNAMTYLHDKNIVHGKLTSVNIYVELNQRVKISLIDNDEHPIAVVETDRRQARVANFNLPSLTYLSPELVRTIHLVRDDTSCDTNEITNVKMDTSKLTKESDVFSFGTLLYELFEERYPFSEICHGSGKTGCINFSPPLTSSPIKTTRFDSPLAAPKWNGNIKLSASELIYQIGCDQMAAKNPSGQYSKWPTLVEQTIKSCWSGRPEARTQFKRLSFL